MTREPDLFGQEAGFDPPPDQDADEETVELAIHHETPKAFIVSQTGDEKKTFSLPRSQVTAKPTGKHTNEPGHPKYAIAEFTMPVWLAKDRGLV